MDLDTVSGLVTALVCAYDAGLEYYTKWQRRKWQQNNYENHARGMSGSGSCGLSTSLSYSGPKIRDLYRSSAETLGDAFSVGDEQCRDTLFANLEQLQARVDVLHIAMTRDNGPLELFETIRVSEAVRISTLNTLTLQHQRVASSRPVSRDVHGPLGLSPVSYSGADEETDDAIPRPSTPTNPRAEDDAEMTHYAASSSKSIFQSEPPSPPPTPPKIRPDDLESTYTSASGGYGQRPKNSIFSLFCPDALDYQVDPSKSMPENWKCRCGYVAEGAQPNARDATVLKDGFQLRPRFLAKSHCEKGRYGCVLCTSSGKTETYDSVEGLRDHINDSHDKWQMLHDRDMVGR